jgi:NitT/TauT family transport system substrate-binding protein
MTAGYGARLLSLSLLVLAACTATAPAGSSAPAKPAAAAPTAAPPASEAAPPASAPTAAPVVQRTRVIAGYIPAIAAAAYYLGQERGYFDAEGIDLESENVAVTTEALAQVAAGNLHVANITVGVAALNVFASGIDVKIIGGTFGTPPTGPHGYPLLVRKALYDSGEVRDVATLRGRKIALNGTAVWSEYILGQGLKTGGLTVEDVDVQIMSFPDMPVALGNAAIDGAIPPEPFSTQAQEMGVATPLVTDYIHGVPGGVMIAGESFLKDRPALEGFLRAYLRSLRDLQREGPTSPEIAALIEKYTRVPVAVLQKIRPTYDDPELRVDVPGLMDQQRFYMDRGYLRYTEPLDLNRFVDDGPRTAALRAVGTR